MKFWLMKTYKDWAEQFIDVPEEPFVAIDEEGTDEDYGKLREVQRDKLFENIAKNSSKNRRWATIKRFYDEFYDEVEIGDVLILGVGQTTKFNVYAIVMIESDAYYVHSQSSNDMRHRRKVKVIWRDEPYNVSSWGWANRLAKMDTKERLEEFMEVYIGLTVK